ncbi:family 43 glycosylhydrolase [Saccharothrix sp. 6-C]|uniref:beta-xylosidase family glycoside hydrolase n=1 Tax=Saccharothrix sp. 6-C TaxID=2781735 RepID=UPI001916F892|nr:family 43 glycosylhydrolase [Saccharothrix sp. 6-C]QQQ79326.1 family 43 glycosylhydrolase [Saccharothrix sp. 6-C]
MPPLVHSRPRPRRLMRMLPAAAATVLLTAGLVPVTAHAADEWTPASSYTSTDKGDGSYSVPLLNSDVPDVSVERVPAAENDEGRDLYYMISTTMHLSPGAPVMKSYDLVNWEVVNYVFDRLDIGDSFSLRNGQNSYGQGQWASSLRYHGGKFYVAFNTNNLGGSYLYSTDDIEDGAWTRVPLGRAFHDPSLFFDERDGGTPYIFYGSGSTSAVKLSPDLTRVVAEYPNILRPADFPGSPFLGGLFEGAQVQYIDGNYYVVIITWPSGQGRQVVLFRSPHLLGRYATADGANPYQARGALNSNGFAQGSLVPISRDGGRTDWHGMFFRDSFPVGRIPALIPATWQDGWPTFGTAGAVPVNGLFDKPIRLSPAEETLERQKSLVASDDFANDAPHKAYMDERWTIPSPPDVDESLLGVELVRNPGFESGAVTPWAAQFGARLALEPVDGATALKVADRTLNGSGPNQQLDGVLQRGVTYAVSARVKYAAGPATVRFNLAADWGAGVQVMASGDVPVGRWTTVSGRYTVPAAAAVDKVKFAVETPWANPQPPSSTVEYLLDDVSVVGQPVTTEHPTEAEVAPNGSRLGLAWEWNHAPDNRHWSLTDREGWLRLTTGKVLTGDYVYGKLSNRAGLTWFEEARNTLSQRTFGPKGSAETKLDFAGMKDGDVAGLAMYNRGFSYAAVKRVDGRATLGVVNRVQPFPVTFDRAAAESFVPGTEVPLGDATEVHLKGDVEFDAPTGQGWTTFHYSLDGLNWHRLGQRVGPQTLDGSLAHFMGHRWGLFNYATKQAGGTVDFDHFLLSDTLTAQGEPLDTTALDAAIAHASTLDEHHYPAAAWSAMREALRKAQAARRTAFGTQNQVDAPERALSLELARLGVARVPVAVRASTRTRCAGPHVQLTVEVANHEAVPVDVSITTPYGAKSFRDVPPGKTRSHPFTTRESDVPAGSVSVTASATVDGVPRSVALEVPHDGRACE